MGLQVQVLKAGTSREIEAAFATLVRERADALFVGPNPFFIIQALHRKAITSRRR